MHARAQNKSTHTCNKHKYTRHAGGAEQEGEEVGSTQAPSWLETELARVAYETDTWQLLQVTNALYVHV